MVLVAFEPDVLDSDRARYKSLIKLFIHVQQPITNYSSEDEFKADFVRRDKRKPVVLLDFQESIEHTRRFAEFLSGQQPVVVHFLSPSDLNRGVAWFVDRFVLEDDEED
jgi:hypothetical protein